jgi:hypothetical protein
MTASMDEERAGVSSSPATEHEEAGDPACWAHRVCPECNRLNQADHRTRVRHAGWPFPPTRREVPAFESVSGQRARQLA